MRQSQGLTIHRITPIQHGRLHSPPTGYYPHMCAVVRSIPVELPLRRLYDTVA
jgi:hypothetical protein